MTVQEFFDKYNGKGVDFDGYYGFQCMDLAHQYATEVVGKDFSPAPAAKDVWNQTIDGYDKITNSPTGVPQKGDIVIWGTAIGAYGHIAIFDHGDTNTFTSFDQNWPLNSLCHLQNHNYTGVLGWFHPKNIEPTIQVKVSDFENLVAKSTKYDAFVVSGYNTIDDVNAKIKTIQDGNNALRLDITNKDAEIANLKNQIASTPIPVPPQPSNLNDSVRFNSIKQIASKFHFFYQSDFKKIKDLC